MAPSSERGRSYVHTHSDLFRLHLTLLLHRRGHRRKAEAGVRSSGRMAWVWRSIPETPPEGTPMAKRFPSRGHQAHDGDTFAPWARPSGSPLLTGPFCPTPAWPFRQRNSPGSTICSSRFNGPVRGVFFSRSRHRKYRCPHADRAGRGPRCRGDETGACKAGSICRCSKRQRRRRPSGA